MMPSKELIDGEWMKICSRKECHLAGQYQPVNNFNKDKQKKCGFKSHCKRCRSTERRHKILSEEQKEKRRVAVREHYLRNYQKDKDKRNKKRREKYATDPEYRKKVKEQNKKWQAKLDSKERKERNKKLWERRGKTKEYRKRKREYYQNNELARIKNNVSRSIRSALQRQGAKKDYKTFQTLPYTPKELRDHIENQFDEKMNWDNYGDYWHIDHIIPQAALPYESIEDENFQKCWALENLRPLEAEENISKGSLYEGERHTYANNKE